MYRMMKRKPGVIQSKTKEELIIVINSSTSFNEIFRKIDLSYGGNVVRVLKKRLDKDNIDYSHIISGCLKNRVQCLRKMPLNDMLVEHCTHSRANIKRRLIEEKILENKCSECGIESTWNGKPIVLTLDHINGIRDDYRVINLRLLCPNCNSQTETFSGRNVKKNNKKIRS